MAKIANTQKKYRFSKCFDISKSRDWDAANPGIQDWLKWLWSRDDYISGLQSLLDSNITNILMLCLCQDTSTVLHC